MPKYVEGMQNSQRFCKFFFSNSSTLMSLRELNHASPVLCNTEISLFFYQIILRGFFITNEKMLFSLSISFARQGFLKVVSVLFRDYSGMPSVFYMHYILGLFHLLYSQWKDSALVTAGDTAETSKLLARSTIKS